MQGFEAHQSCTKQHVVDTRILPVRQLPQQKQKEQHSQSSIIPPIIGSSASEVTPSKHPRPSSRRNKRGARRHTCVNAPEFCVGVFVLIDFLLLLLFLLFILGTCLVMCIIRRPEVAFHLDGLAQSAQEQRVAPVPVQEDTRYHAEWYRGMFGN